MLSLKVRNTPFPSLKGRDGDELESYGLCNSLRRAERLEAVITYSPLPSLGRAPSRQKNGEQALQRREGIRSTPDLSLAAFTSPSLL
jgi:hypothetical protein